MTDQEMADDSSALPEEVLKMSTDDLVGRTRLLDNDCKVMRSEQIRLMHDINSMKEKIKENKDKVKVNKTLPYLVANVIELLDVDGEDQEEDGANVDLDAQRKGKCAVVKTSTRQTYFLPVIGLVEPEELSPGDLVGVNKDSYLILEKLPTEYDSRVKAMEVDEKPTEQYSDVGGLDKQIQELIEAIVLPMTHKERFDAIGIKPPKGCLMYGPPGTGKTLLARACAAQTKATFLKLAGPQLVQMFIGDGAKLVRDAFNLAKEKAPTIIFIDELDAIGTKRFDSEKAGDREVQRTMLELLNQLDGFEPNTDIKVIAATNRVDILDPALLRSGRLDRKIEFPKPDQEARARIMQIHSRKMNVSAEVNFDELSRCTDDFNGAQCKAVCVEAESMLIRAQYVLRMRRSSSMGTAPSRLWAGVRYFDGLTVDEYWTLKRLTQKPDRHNVTRLEQRQAFELFTKAEKYNMEQARAIMAKAVNVKMLANMEKTSNEYRLATKASKTSREDQQYDNMRVMRNLELYGRGISDQVKYNGIGPPDKNIYFTHYLGRGVSGYFFTAMILMTMVLFFSFHIVNSYERFYLAAQHNLIRRTLHEFEQSDLVSKFDYLVNVNSLPNIRSALMKKFTAIDDVKWEFNRDTNFGQINFQFRLDAKNEFVEEGGKPAQYLATLTSMGHVTNESSELIGDMYEKRMEQVLSKNRIGDNIAGVLIIGMVTYFVLEMLSVYAIRHSQSYPFLTNRSIPASRIMKRMPFVAIGCNAAALFAHSGHYLVASHDQLTERYGFPLTNHDPVLEDRDRFGSELEPFTFQKWITHAAVRFMGSSDLSFQSMTRTSTWHIDGLLINIEADPPRQAWIVKPEHFDDDYVETE